MKIFFVTLGLLIFISCSSSKKMDLVPSLENTNWVLNSIGENPYESKINTKPVTLTLKSADSRVIGFGGCNSFSGSYTLEGNTIQFTLMSTKMYCEEMMQIEDYLFKTLTKVEYSINGGVLTLKNDSGHVVKFIF